MQATNKSIRNKCKDILDGLGGIFTGIILIGLAYSIGFIISYLVLPTNFFGNDSPSWTYILPRLFVNLLFGMIFLCFIYASVRWIHKTNGYFRKCTRSDYKRVSVGDIENIEEANLVLKPRDGCWIAVG